jgi:anti-anti-sigma factor
VAAGPNFRIATFQGESGLTIKLAGELDGASCTELIERFDLLAADPETRHIVLDLAEISFVDSAGMRAMIVAERTAADRKLTLTIVPPPAEVTALLEVAGIAEHLRLAPIQDVPASGPFLERIELELSRERSAPGRARRELREALAGRIPDSDRATLVLLTSELVTNAVIHPGPAVEGSIDLRITAYADRVRVEVGDAGGGFTLDELAPRPRESGGHGLIVVEGLSSRWGSGRRPSEKGGGFRVWFELDLAYQPEPEAQAGLSEAAERPVAAAEG